MTELPRIHVVIPAAGIGLRMASDQPKQYLELLDRPILQWTLEKLAKLNLSSIAVALASDDEWFDSIPNTASVLKVTGGASRAESVLSALSAIESDVADWVLVHDAVRPLVKLEDIHRLIEVAVNNGFGAILAHPVPETLKAVSELEVVETVDRSSFWRAQTPQMFPLTELQSALSAMPEATDEASAMEAAGHRIAVVEGDAKNIKITTSSDMAYATFLLRQEQSQ